MEFRRKLQNHNAEMRNLLPKKLQMLMNSLSHTLLRRTSTNSRARFFFFRVRDASKFNILIHEKNVKIREEAEHRVLWLAGIALRTRPSSSSSSPPPPPPLSLSLSLSPYRSFRRYVPAGFVSYSLSLSHPHTHAHTHTETTPDKEGFSAGQSASTERPLMWWWNYEDALVIHGG